MPSPAFAPPSGVLFPPRRPALRPLSLRPVAVARAPPPSSSPSSPPPPPPPPTRVPHSNPSALSRKYRPTPLHPDELELIGTSPSPPVTLPRLETSRFPCTWPAVVRQATDASVAALEAGHDRLLVDVRRPELLLNALGSSASFSSVHLFEDGLEPTFAMTLDVCFALVSRLVSGGGRASGSRVRPSAGIIVFFNSEEEAAAATRAAHPAFRDRVKFQVLDLRGPDRSPTDICVVVAPSNRRGDPSRIEAVERVHYTNWNDSNIVVIVNPDLFALTGFSTFDGCARPPCFLTDYVEAYYLDPQVFVSKHVNGAMLRCFPRKWEAYMQRSRLHPGTFRLISESEAKPRPEKVLCEFGWRADQAQTEGLRPHSRAL